MRVLTYGTFDLFHWGHVELLRRCSELGAELFVGVSTDDFNLQKGKESIFSFNERMSIVASSRYVDHVFPEHSWEQKISDIEKFGIDLFVMGSDWRNKFDYLSSYCRVVYLERTPEISSSSLREGIYARGRIDKT